MSTVSTSELLESTQVGRPHVVLLGAGASLAALPNGDRNGRRLPLMNNLVGVLGLEELLADHGVTEGLDNFERLYGRLAADSTQSELLAALQSQVYDYFTDIELPDEPTLYDKLVLSLREKDVIATFNWDPLLCQAYDRNRRRIPELPSLWFLHGSVTAGPCPTHPNRVGLPGLICPECEQQFQKSPLLYPVEQKNYKADPFIDGAWKAVTEALKSAFAFTVFGYSAPVSDGEARALLCRDWNTNDSRELLETEVIDIKPRGELEATWEPFVYADHCTFATSLEESYLGLYPRRACEAMYFQNAEARWVESELIPEVSSIEQLHEWADPYLAAERRSADA